MIYRYLLVSIKTILSLALVLFAYMFITLAGFGIYYSGKESDHFNGEVFFNPDKPRKTGFLDFLKWKTTSKKEEWPNQVANNFDAIPPEKVDGSKLVVTNIGHASFLIQTEGLNIITDPIFSDRASPFSWIGPKRVRKTGVSWENLPKIDVILVSHNHYDHLDLATLKSLWERDHPRIITPLGNDKIIQNYDQNIQVEAYDWGSFVHIKEGVEVNLDPMQHWSARGLYDRNKALWAAYTIKTPNGNIYFVGDSGYGNGDYFKAAKEKYGSFRFAILPIGAYEPRWFMQYAHMNPEEAIMAYQDLGSPYTIPSQFDVFPMAGEPFEEAPKNLLYHKEKMKAEGFRVLDIGEAWDVPLR